MVARYHLFEFSLFPVKGKVFKGTSLTEDMVAGGGSAMGGTGVFITVCARRGVNEEGAGGSTGESVLDEVGELSDESENSSVSLDGGAEGTRGSMGLLVGAGGTGGFRDVMVYPLAQWLGSLI